LYATTIEINNTTTVGVVIAAVNIAVVKIVVILVVETGLGVRLIQMIEDENQGSNSEFQPNSNPNKLNLINMG